VTLVSLTITSPWTACGEPNCDPYVEVTLGSTSKTSSAKSDSNSPTWDEQLFTATGSDLTSSTMQVDIYDDDLLGLYDWVGECYLQVSSTDLSAGKLVQACGAYVTNLTFKFDAS
jgi:hypothetical protein